jgi:hypothetical protein
MKKIAPYGKAITAAVVAGLGSLYQALDGDPAVVTAQEWVAIAMTTLVGLGVVFGVPNKDPEVRHQDESVQPPAVGDVIGRHERGNVSLLYVLLVVLVVLVILAVLGLL